MWVVVCAGSPVHMNGVRLTSKATSYLRELLKDIDPTGKLAFENIIEDRVNGGYIVTLYRHHPELVKVIEDRGAVAGHGDCCPLLIDIRFGDYIIERSENLEFICDPVTKKQL